LLTNWLDGIKTKVVTVMCNWRMQT